MLDSLKLYEDAQKKDIFNTQLLEEFKGKIILWGPDHFVTIPLLALGARHRLDWCTDNGTTQNHLKQQFVTIRLVKFIIL